MPGAIVENDRGHGSKRHCSSTNEPETGTSKELQISGEAGISPVTHCQYVDGKAIRRLGSSSNIRGEDEAPAIPLWEFPGIWGRFVRSLFEVIRPRVQPGYRRIEWVCDCGEELYGDFDNSRPEALDALAGVLNRLPSHASIEGDGHQMSTLNRHTTEPTLAHISNNVGHFENNQRSFPQPIVKMSIPACPPIQRLEKYLELCVNVGEHNITLAEIRISTSQSQITTDGELFQEIRKSYGKRRGFLRTHSLHLFKPAKVDFVQFCLADDLVGILNGPLSFPTEEDIKSKRWEFPCPLQNPPPIPNNIFLHYLNSSGSHPRNIWLSRFPIKLNTSIYQDSTPSHADWQGCGWGIQIIEGPNKKAMLWLTILVVLISLVFASLWAFFTKDVQAAFGIAAYIVAAASALLLAFFNYY